MANNQEQTLSAEDDLKVDLPCMPRTMGRTRDIFDYRQKMRNLGFSPDAVMTLPNDIPEWEKSVIAG